MARPCGICTHADRAAIEALLIAGVPSFAKIADRFGTSPAALSRHRSEHVAAAIARAEAKQAAQTQAIVVRQEQIESAKDQGVLDQILGKVERIAAKVERIADVAEATGNLPTAIAGARELREQLEFIAKLRGVLATGNTTNIHNDVRILQVPALSEQMAKLIAALQPFPEALSAARAVLGAEGSR